MRGQTPLRAIIVALVAAAALIAGAWLLAARYGEGLTTFVAVMLLAADGASILCALAGWAGVLAGLIAVVAFYAAFVEDEEPEGVRRLPKGVPAFLFLASLGLIWLSLLCASRAPAPPPKPVRIAPAEVVEPPDAPEPVAVPVEPEAAPPPPPEVSARALPLRWIYADPLIFNGYWSASSELRAELRELFPLRDPDGPARALLCDSAWVAFAGAASQEGPRARNDRRARVRAELAIAAARAWLDARVAECAQQPVLLGVDLGQHLETLDHPAPAESAVQRQLLIVRRPAASADERLSAEAALAELDDFLADPAGRARLLDGRLYARAPLAFVPADPS